jgi:hypothetical protein
MTKNLTLQKNSYNLLKNSKNWLKIKIFFRKSLLIRKQSSKII